MDIPIFDGHNDSLRHLHPCTDQRLADYVTGRTPGAIDLPRAQIGGFAGGFFAIYVPADPVASAVEPTGVIVTPTGYEVPLAAPISFSYAQTMTQTMIDALFRLAAVSDGALKVTRTLADVDRCLQDGTIAAVLHFEGAEAIDPQLDALEMYYRAGLRSLGIVWSRANSFGSGVPFGFPRSPDTGPGLTAAGRSLVHACNWLGIMLDVSHLTERGFWDLAATTTAPIVATHSAVHAICPATRNLTDKQIDAIGESQGIVGINFEVSSLRSDWHDDPNTSLDVLVRHIDYVVERIGIECIGFGSDFDGATMPHELEDVAALPQLIAKLREHGYDDVALRKIAYANWLRILGATWCE